MVELVHWYSVDHRHFAMVVLEHKHHVEVLEVKLDAFKVDKFHFIQCYHQRRLHRDTDTRQLGLSPKMFFLLVVSSMCFVILLLFFLNSFLLCILCFNAALA